MPSEKIDTQFSLALELPEEDRSAGLNTGFDPITQTWEIIIKYSGILSSILENIPGISSSAELSGGFAVLIIQENSIPILAQKKEIIYIDKPKNLFFGLENGVPSACIPPMLRSTLNLSGRGTIACIIDSGIEYTHSDFCTPDRKTRILAIWDQTIPSNTVLKYNSNEFLSAPEGYFPGTLFPQEQINAALSAPNSIARQELCPTFDSSGHGTHVAGICAGNGAASNGRYRGCAYEADLLIVKLGKSVNSSYPTTTQLMQAADWAIHYAASIGKPIAINLSFGNNYGAHDGSSLTEQFLNNLSNLWKCIIAAGTGNEGSGGIHYQTKLPITQRNPVDFECKQTRSNTSSIEETINETSFGNINCPTAELTIAPYETALSLQIWKNFYDDFELSILPPSGNPRYPVSLFPGVQRVVLDRVRLLIYYGESTPFQRKQEIFIQFQPIDDFLTQGVWQFRIRPRRIFEGTVSMWLPSREILNSGTRFLNPSEELTLTIPSTAEKVISVAAYDELTLSPAWFSGRGFVLTSDTGISLYKPELTAPGVSITAPGRENSYVSKSGTSMATPFVTGTSLLFMEWGIIKRNDPFLYGEKLKVLLISGTKILPGLTQYPNSEIGYGTLCAERTASNLLIR